ncbi:hypothetical protein NQZ68_009930 [Dissostichus eleginoides]|nr:hypothetical protein NQZ68_009930 [Dissostichus eleginoides]
MSWIFLVSTTIFHLCAPSPLAAIAANKLLPAFPPVIMLKYSISQLLSLNNSSTPSSISVIRHLGLPRRPRYIHRSTRRSFVYFQHGQSIASICSTQRTPDASSDRNSYCFSYTFPPSLHSQLHGIPGADSTPLRLPTHITSHFSPPSSHPPLLHRPPSRAHPRAANLDNLIPVQPDTTPLTPHLTNLALLTIRRPSD